ncbi:hypothetical protein [Streptomyces roseoverticillatus]|uniref:Secreted protein n=1 Tax=Streptomyces roseoverticillatus TaxID=66429 RepID=A0ABV3IMF5_9ACTN
MKRLRSALTTAAATVLLSVCGVVLASPAHAEGSVSVLGGTVTVKLDGVIELGLFGGTVLSLQNPLEGVV